MNATLNFKEIFPIIIDLVNENDHNIGVSDFGYNPNGCNKFDNYEPNNVCYEKDGWLFDIYYQCCGEWSDNEDGLKRGWGYVSEIIASGEDEDGNVVEISEEEKEELENLINKELKKL